MTTEKWLIIGGGAVVQEYYLNAFAHLDLLDAITILEPNKKTCKQFKEKNIVFVNTDLEEFFSDTKTRYDKAIITLPNHLHERAVQLCLQNDIDVLCEKPLVLTTEACDRIKTLATAKNQAVYSAMVRRYMPSFQVLKKSLNLVGKIDKIEVEDGNPFAWVADSYAFFDPKNGGVLADMGVHYLDLLFELFGKLTPISYSDDCEGGVEANATYYIQAKGEIEISLALSRTKKLKNTFEITGSEGRLWMEKDNFKSCFFSPNDGISHEITLENAFTDTSLNYIFESCFVEQLMAFSEKSGKLVGLDEAEHVIGLIEWAYKQRVVKPNKTGEDSYFITGATGFIGTALIERLWQNGNKNITAGVRGYKNCAPIARFGIKLPKINLLDYEQVATSLYNKQYVVHLAYATDGKNAYAINVEGTKNVVKAASAAGAEAVVILSTMNVYGFPNGVADENTHKKPAGGDYGKSKRMMQDWCLEFAKTQTKTRIVVLNPTCVYGPNGKTYTTLPLVLAKSNRFCWIDEGAGLANVVYIENLLDAIELALSIKEAHGKNFIINDDTMTWKSFLSPLLITYANNLPSLATDELLSQNFREKTNLKGIVRYLLANYEFVSLINQHPVLGKLKKSLFKTIPKFRNKLDKEREVEWKGGSAENLVKSVDQPFNPPAWLNELFGNTNSKFSAKKAEDILGWKSRITTKEALLKTEEWLKTQN